MNRYSPTVQIYNPPNTDAPLHWISDLDYWHKLFRSEAEINKKHKHDVMKLIDDNVAALKKSAILSTDCQGENMFKESMKSFIDRLTDQKKEYSKCARNFFQMENTIVKFKNKDKWGKHIHSYNKQLKYLHKKLGNMSARIERIRKMYHKARFTAQKQAVKVRLCVKPEIGHDVKKNGEKATERANGLYSTYEEMVQTWNKMATDARLLSMEYETAYVERELERAELVMSSLEKLEVPRNRNTNRNIMFGEFAFSGMDLRDMIEQLATGEDFMKVIECPKLQEYDPSKHLVQMYEDAKRELSQEEDGRAGLTQDNSDIGLSLDSECEDVGEIMSDSELNNVLTQRKKCQYVVVIKEYKKQDGTEINLKLGERVKQLLPANTKGMAFGEVKHGILNKKKKGFYPVDNTKLVTTLNAEGDSNNGKKLKLAHKYQKKVKKSKSNDKNSQTSLPNAPKTSNSQTISNGRAYHQAINNMDTVDVKTAKECVDGGKIGQKVGRSDDGSLVGLR